MKKFVICGMLSLSILFTSCLGSFSAFNSLRDWNQGISDSRFINNVVFWALIIVPVYEIFLIGDTLIFNPIEFWTGNNPLAMKEGEKEVQMVEKDGNTLKITATRNHMLLEVVAGPKTGEKLQLEYLPEEHSWNAVKENGERIKLSSMHEGFYMVYLPNGEAVRIDAGLSREEGINLLKQEAACYQLDGMYALGK